MAKSKSKQSDRPTIGSAPATRQTPTRQTLAQDGSSRTVLITGSGARIGKTLALDFARRGWNVGVHYNSSRAAAEDVVAQIQDLGPQAAALAADLKCANQVDDLISQCQDALGPVSCLINNASVFLRDTSSSMTNESWAAHIDINLRAPIFLARSFAAQLPDGLGGNIINLIDQRVWNLSPDFFSYTISKAGLWTATQTLAQALAPGIRVNAIGPGPVLKSIHQSDAEFELERRSTPLGHGTSAQEIARAIRFILDAPAMSGQMIALDGGQHLSWHGAKSAHEIPSPERILSRNDKPEP